VQVGVDFAPVVGGILRVIVAHCARAKESSVWIPCSKLAPAIVYKAPSAKALAVLLTSAVRSEANKHAGCREAAGRSLERMLDSPAARPFVLPKLDEVGQVVVSLLTDTAKLERSAPKSTPDVRQAGVACYRALRTLDEATANVVHEATLEKHPAVAARLA
jgi:hypothetical protein